jgi:chromosome segregation ATPase
LSTINITYDELKDVQTFCELNKIEDTSSFIKNCFKKGFNIEKYGLLDTTKPEVIEKEVEKIVFRDVEKIVEVPVIEYIEIEKEVEKIVEVVKEIPTAPTEIEVIRYVDREVVREVPVERVVIQEVIKEVSVDKIVEKEVYITDDEAVKELGEKIAKLEESNKNLEEYNQEISTKNQKLTNDVENFSTMKTEMENIFQNEMSKKDEELDKLRHTLDELLAKPPVEIIKEIPTVVEKTTVDDSKQKALEETLRKLRVQMSEKDKKIKELETTIQEIQSMGGKGATYLSGSNLGKTFK